MIDDMAPWGRRGNELISAANVINEQMKTEVADCISDGIYRKGSVDFPIFDVTPDEFNRNMEAHRQRCRFKTEKVLNYVRGSRTKNPFYIRAEIDGKSYIRKIY